MRALMKFAAVLVTLTGCTTLTTATATETAICDAWEDTLPTRSRSDTEQTQSEVGQNRATFRAVCR